MVNGWIKNIERKIQLQFTRYTISVKFLKSSGMKALLKLSQYNSFLLKFTYFNVHFECLKFLVIFPKHVWCILNLFHISRAPQRIILCIMLYTLTFMMQTFDCFMNFWRGSHLTIVTLFWEATWKSTVFWDIIYSIIKLNFLDLAQNVSLNLLTKQPLTILNG